MNYVKSNPCRTQLTDTIDLLMKYETAVIKNSGGKSISYDIETNMYNYTSNLGSETIVSLYSTSDVLNYHFGSNLDNVMANGDVFIISENSGYDIIIYRNEVLGFGATDSITKDPIKDEIKSIGLDTSKAYTVQELNDRHYGGAIAVEAMSTYGKIFPDLFDTGNTSQYKVGAFPDIFITLNSFDPSWKLGAIFGLECEDITDIGLAKAGQNHLYYIKYKSNNDSKLSFKPDVFNNDLTGYDEYYASTVMGNMSYDGPEMSISFKDSVWYNEIQESVKDDFINSIAVSEIKDFAPISNISPVLLPIYVAYKLNQYSKLQDIMKVDSNENLMNSVKSLKSTVGTAAQTAPIIYADPLILDLDGDGFNVESKENGSHFDLDKNSFAEKINWTKKDGYLCLDLNGNGVIDNGGELFGDETLLADGTGAENGFAALAQYDSNKDGIIDQNDEIFGSLRVWVDSDGSGTSGEGEMKTLSELGVKSISLGYENVNAETGTEAVIGNMASFVMADGTVNQIGELWVSSDLFDTAETAGIEIPDDIKALPNIRSIGNVHSLHTAMALDETGELKALVESLVSENDIEKRKAIVTDILYYVTGADKVADGSRGTDMDAKQLTVIEAMLGENYVGTSGANPHRDAAPILRQAYSNIFDAYYNELCAQTYIKEYIPLFRYKENEDGTRTLNADVVNFVLEYQLSHGDENAENKLRDVAYYVKYMDDSGIKGMDDFVMHYAAVSMEYAHIAGMFMPSSYFANGTDSCEGDTNGNYMFGTDTADEIYGYNGNDTLIGGKGDDILYGGTEDDTYIFNLGDGNDLIDDYVRNYYNSRSDKVVFGEGIKAEDIYLTRSGNDMILRYSENDSLTIKDAYVNDWYWVESFEFVKRLCVQGRFCCRFSVLFSGVLCFIISPFL